MDFNMLYLEQKHLVKLLVVLGSLWANANINSFGIDVIENKDKFANQFPFISVQIQNIQDSTVVGNVVQAREQAKVVIQKTNDAFPQARNITKTSQIPDELKKEILRRLDTLEENIKESNAGAIQKGWNWFKENAVFLIPILQPVIIEIGKLLFS